MSKTVSQFLVGLAQDRYEIGRATTGEPFAALGGVGPIVHPLRGGLNSFRAELGRLYFEVTGKVAGSGALSDALNTLEGMAQLATPRELALRCAIGAGGKIIIDLGSPAEELVEIDPATRSWSVGDDKPEVWFRRTRLTGEIPAPDQRATLQDLQLLRRHVNIADEDLPLLLAWLLSCWLPDRPCPALLLTGEQGTAKTTTAKTLIGLVDPSPAELRASPDDIKDWAVTASASRVVGLDNLSGIAPWFSDVLCRAVTGEGFAKRSLYTDSDLIVLQIRRAIVLTAIDAGSLRGDLADRLLSFELEPIDPSCRMTDADITSRLDADRPLIIGALLTLLANALAELPDVQLELLPRMADFARLVRAVDTVLATDGLDRYRGASHRLAVEVVEGDQLAQAIRSLMADRDTWTGSASSLLDVLNLHHEGAKPKWWPANGSKCSASLKRKAPTLREAFGIHIEWKKSGSVRTIVITNETTEPEEGRQIESAVPRDGTSQSAVPAPKPEMAGETPNVGRQGRQTDPSCLFTVNKEEREIEIAEQPSLPSQTEHDDYANERHAYTTWLATNPPHQGPDEGPQS